jgi:hypothetical protein
MRACTAIVVGVVLSLLFWVLPARAAPLVSIARRASGLVAVGPQAPTEIGRHRTELPNGSEYVSFPAQVRLLRPDGKEQVEEATCYLKDHQPKKGEKPPPTKAEKEEIVCLVGTGLAVYVGCLEVGSICAGGGALVFPAFCGGAAVGCGVAVIVVGAVGAVYASRDTSSLGNDDVGAGVPPDNAAVTNGVSGLLGGGVDPTPDPNDDPGESAPDVGGGD